VTFRRTSPLLLLLLWTISVTAAAQTTKYAGRPVADVLRELQSNDLRIIFSSDLVPSSLRVNAEPKGRSPRDVAEQILAAHGLALQKGPGETWIVISGSLGLTSGDALAEGRLPGTESGSWWVTARGTYYRLLVDRLNNRCLRFLVRERRAH
jgi:hypothetical protein